MKTIYVFSGRFVCSSTYGLTTKNFENKAIEICRSYCDAHNISSKHFEGVALEDLELVSQHFYIGINCYEIDKKRSSKLLFRSLKQDNIMYLNLWKNHYSWIKAWM